jgi:hypothetical protein
VDTDSVLPFSFCVSGTVLSSLYETAGGLLAPDSSLWRSPLGYCFLPVCYYCVVRYEQLIQVVLTFFLAFIYVAELLCKAILQQYYQFFSVLSTAAGNKLSDYKDAVFQGILENYVGIIGLFLPVFFAYSSDSLVEKRERDCIFCQRF